MLFLAQYRIRVRYVYFKVMLKKIVATDGIENESLLLQKHRGGGGEKIIASIMGFPSVLGASAASQFPAR